MFPSSLSKKKVSKFSLHLKPVYSLLKIFWGWCNICTKICPLFHLWDVEEICKYSQTHFSLCGTVKAESVTFKYLKSISADDFYFFRNIPFICNYLASNHVQRKQYKEDILNHIHRNSRSFKKKKKRLYVISLATPNKKTHTLNIAKEVIQLSSTYNLWAITEILPWHHSEMFTECHCKGLRGLSKDQLKEKGTRQDCSPEGKSKNNGVRWIWFSIFLFCL